MFESTTMSPLIASAVERAQAAYLGPERRQGSRDPAVWLARMLDEIDCGMLLVTPEGHVTHVNLAARLELDGHHPLQASGRRLAARRPQDLALLQDALGKAQHGLRRLVTLGEGEGCVGISVVPLPLPLPGGVPAGPVTTLLLVLGKRRVGEWLPVQGFARSAGLTRAETRVLELLCGGARPEDIAREGGVAVSTVRTQIGSIRAKTGATSIRHLVQQVAVLPPLADALHGAPRDLAA